MEKLARHRRNWKLLRFVLTPFLRLFLRYSGESCVCERPTLILSNHTTDYDPLLIATCFPRHMYFVASEHIFRWGLASRVIRRLVDPIVRVKSRGAGDTVREIRRRIEAGANVHIFAEGNRSWNGVTGFISPATGRLVKSCGCELVTYTLHGGYLKSPRWAKRERRGRMYGRLAGRYSAEEIGAMSADEINAVIARDLHVDAYAEDTGRYPGRERAMYLETALFVCPECGGIATLCSEGDRLFCKSCGMELCYDEYGRFRGEAGEPRFTNVRDWDAWQRGEIARRAEEYRNSGDSSKPFLVCENEEARLVSEGRGEEVIATGSLAFFADALTLPDGERIAYADIRAMSGQGRRRLSFTTDDGRFIELCAGAPRATVLCIMLYRLFTGREYI